VQFLNNQNTIKCPGVELRGLQVNQIPRRNLQDLPSLEYNCFTPYLDHPEHLNTSNSKEIFTKTNAIRCSLDIALENCGNLKPKIVEIQSVKDNESLEIFVKEIIRMKLSFDVRKFDGL